MSTPKQLAEEIGVAYHVEHTSRDPDNWFNKAKGQWISFKDCTREICQDSRTLIGHLEYQARLLKDCEIFLGVEVWADISGKQEVSA